VNWGAKDAMEPVPVIARLTDPEKRYTVGTHSGSYAMYHVLAVAAGALDPDYVPDLTDTAPWHPISQHPQWFDPGKIVSLDPFGAVVV
jgi:hypothetical protein